MRAKFFDLEDESSLSPVVDNSVGHLAAVVEGQTAPQAGIVYRGEQFNQDAQFAVTPARVEFVRFDAATNLSLEPDGASVSTDFAPVFNTAAVNTPAYDITLSFSGDTQYLSYFQAAERMWELIITADIPDVPGVPSPAPSTVDDLFIEASVIPIDGVNGILGQAGPGYVRIPSYLPITGEMIFDSADVANLVSNGTFQNVIMHEMAHVLGLGTVWGSGYWGHVNAGPNYQYTGLSALVEYRLLANNPGAAFVQVENGGGAGTAGGHWDEAIFTNELMTGYIGAGSSPISRMTIAALRDGGYTVDLGYSDPFWLASTPLAFRDDFSGNYNTSTVLSIGVGQTGTIELNEDNDWFRVNLTAGTTYTLTMRGQPGGGGTLTDSFLRLRATDGEILAFNDNGTNADSTIVFTAASSGTFFVDASAAGIQAGSYTVTVAVDAPLFTSGNDNVTLVTSGASWDALAGNDIVNGTVGVDTISGGSGLDTLYGLGGADTLNGNDDGDVLDGGTGGDTMAGGAGSDIYYVDDASDSVTETDAVIATGGFDTVYATTSFTLGSNVEQLSLYGGSAGLTATGNAEANVLFGNLHIGGVTLLGLGGNDVFYGSNYADTIDGGAEDDILQAFYSVDGVDTLIGGAGDDVYYTFETGDIITELVGGGLDTVYAQASIVLGDNIEQLIVYGATTSATGNASNNNMFGNNSTNALMMSGLGGDDWIIGSNFSDTLNGGADNDQLQGLGGANVMSGGSGDDIYYSTFFVDTITEQSGEGFDTLFADYSVIALAANVEQLVIYGGATTGTGNGLDNTIYGNNNSVALIIDGLAGNDVIYGSSVGDQITGGLGDDTLLGLGGTDTFRYNSSGNMGADTIIDFTDGTELISLAGLSYSAADIGSAITISGGANALVTFSGGSLAGTTIAINAIDQANVTAADFLF